MSLALLPCTAWAVLNLLYVHSSECSTYCSCCLCGCGTLDAHQRGVTVQRKAPAAFLQVLTLCSPRSALQCSSTGAELHVGLPSLQISESLSAEWMEVDVPTAMGQRAQPRGCRCDRLYLLRRGEGMGFCVPSGYCAIPQGSTGFSSQQCFNMALSVLGK